MVAVLFTFNCVSYHKGALISSRPLTENQDKAFKMTIELIKNPTQHDPVAEYKIVKMPLSLHQDTYEKVKKYKRLPTAILGLVAGFLGGAVAGTMIGAGQTDDHEMIYLYRCGGALAFGLAGFIVPMAVKGKTKVVGTYVENSNRVDPSKNNNSGINFADKPVTINLRSESAGQNNPLKLWTDAQGVLKIDLQKDLGLKKLEKNQLLPLRLQYMNEDSQIWEEVSTTIQLAE